MLVIERFIQGPERCGYLPAETQTLAYEWVAHMTPAEYEIRMNEGWRKFGSLVFRPVCAACRQCLPVRIPVAAFSPDRSMRRVLARNADLEVFLGEPEVDREHLDLYALYHQTQAARKHWPYEGISPETYAFSFVENPFDGLELSIRKDGELLAVALVDPTPNALSAIYHYYDPRAGRRSLGTFALLRVFALAAAMGKPYVHLGYYVKGCASMEYKLRYGPHELLGPDGVWRPPDLL